MAGAAGRGEVWRRRIPHASGQSSWSVQVHVDTQCAPRTCDPAHPFTQPPSQPASSPCRPAEQLLPRPRHRTPPPPEQLLALGQLVLADEALERVPAGRVGDDGLAPVGGGGVWGVGRGAAVRMGRCKQATQPPVPDSHLLTHTRCRDSSLILIGHPHSARPLPSPRGVTPPSMDGHLGPGVQ